MPHHVDEGMVLDAGLLDPDDIVEQQLFTVGGRQTGQGQPWSMNDHLPQFANFRVHSELRHVTAPPSFADPRLGPAMGKASQFHLMPLVTAQTDRLSPAMMMIVRMRSRGHMKPSHRL